MLLGQNAWLVDEMYEQYRANPNSVSASWQEFFADYGTWYQLGLGVLAIAVTLLFRQGLWGWVQGKTGLTLFPTQRRLKVEL